MKNSNLQNWKIRREAFPTDHSLYHHGIKGMIWGKRNGPPYPLDYSDHSPKEKRLMTKAQKEKAKGEKPSKSGFSIDKKQLMKQAAIAAGVALAIAGGYALYESGALDKLVRTGKGAVGNIDLDQPLPETGGPKDILSRIKTKVADSSLAGFSPKQLREQMPMIESINGGNTGDNGKDNCSSCTAAYLLNRLFGGKFKALGADIFGHKGRKVEEIEKLFKEGTIDHLEDSSAFANMAGRYGARFKQSLIDIIPNGTTGMIAFNDGNPIVDELGNIKFDKDGKPEMRRHIAAYEKTIDGVFTYVENQHGKIFEGESLQKMFDHPSLKYVEAILDCSKAELSDDFGKIAHKWVG